MNLTYEEVIELKNALVKAQHFSYAAKFRDEEKRLFSLMPKKKQKEITDFKNSIKAAGGEGMGLGIRKHHIAQYQKIVIAIRENRRGNRLGANRQ